MEWWRVGVLGRTERLLTLALSSIEEERGIGIHF